LLLSLFKSGSRVVHNLFHYTMVQSSQEGARYLWKRGAWGYCLVILP